MSYDEASTRLVLDGYNGGAIKASGADISIFVQSDSTVTSDGHEALFFGNRTNIDGVPGAQFTLNANHGRALYYNVTVNRITLNVNANNINNKDNYVIGVGGSMTLSNGATLIINVNGHTETTRGGAYGLMGTLTMEDTATADITVNERSATATEKAYGIANAVYLKGTGKLKVTTTSFSPTLPQAMYSKPTAAGYVATSGSWDEPSVTYEFISSAVVSKVDVKTPPTKTNYNTTGEQLDLSGLVVTLTKLDNSTEDVFLRTFLPKVSPLLRSIM